MAPALRQTNNSGITGITSIKIATQTYSYVHESPFSGVNYNRLKQVCLDGTYSYSTIRSIRFDSGSVIKVYPNPANDVIKIEGLSAGVTVVVDVCDANGLIVIPPQATDSGRLGS